MPIVIVGMWLVASCTTTKYIPVHTTNTEYVNKIQYDSVYVHDSIDKLMKGDSVVITNYKYVYKTNVKVDTFIKTDTIPIPVPVIETKEVNRLKWYQKILIALGSISVVFFSFKLGRLIKWK